MPNLPRIPRTVRRRRQAQQRLPVERSEPQVAELEFGGVRWLNIEEPTATETGWLAEHFDFHELDLEDVLSTRQRPKIDEYDDYLFMVLHLPYFDKSIGRLNAAELNIFVGADYVITLPNITLKPVGRLFSRLSNSSELREEYFSKGAGYLLYEILSESFDYCFPILDKIGFKLDRLQNAIWEERSEDVARDISNAKQEIIAYRKIIKPERSTLRLLERVRARYLPEDLEVYFDDIVDSSERIWDQLDNYKEVVEALEQTNETVIAHRQNDILRVLTVFSVIILPLTLITGIYGMNFEHIPFSHAAARVLRRNRRHAADLGRACSGSSAGRGGSRRGAVVGAVAAGVRRRRLQRQGRRPLHLLREAGRRRRRPRADRPPRRALLRAAQPLPVLERPPDGRALPPRRRRPASSTRRSAPSCGS